MDPIELMEKINEVRGMVYLHEWAEKTKEIELDPSEVLVQRYKFYCENNKTT